ncbi:MAG: two-component sensor histidine kinase [Clostridia bacterium]|nr:ATP-binding protein [Lachnospiraceae bacterium]NCC01512.1 two-component sensor histidine kinase [Clostridia bacterium]NCD03357.1 two-component sensor histidine kinase [Clostridia bacterium]
MKKKMIRNTIGIVVAAVILTFLAVTALMYNHSVDLLKDGVTSEAESLQAAIDMEGYDFLISAKIIHMNRRITIISREGTVLYDSEADARTMDNHKDRPEVAQALYQGTGSSTRVSETLDQQDYYYALTLTNGYILRVSGSMDSVYQMMWDMAPYMVALALVIIGVAIIIIRVETSRMVRPINDINLDKPLDEQNYEELMPLLNRMDQQNERIRIQMEELKHAEGMRREFSANVSHELKTPLMAISGYAEIISRNMVKKEDIPEFADRIYKEANRMTTLVEDIIKLSRLDEQSDMMPFESVDLNRVTNEIVDALQMVARKRNIALTVDGDVPPVNGVRQVIYEMLYNLCDNAIKYNQDGGSVHVLLEPSPKPDYAVRWSVWDTGIGVPEDEQERIFERFYRVDKSHSRETGGTGLGLAIVKHGANLHDALVTVDSKLNEGTCIAVEFRG